jgi:hypothetical protein
MAAIGNGLMVTVVGDDAADEQPGPLEIITE